MAVLQGRDGRFRETLLCNTAIDSNASTARLSNSCALRPLIACDTHLVSVSSLACAGTMTIFSAILVAASVAAVSAEASEQQYHETVATDIFLKVVTPMLHSHEELAARKWHEKFVKKQEERHGTSSPLAWSFSECSAAPPSSPVLGSSGVQVGGINICSIGCKAADSACTYLCKKTPISEKTCISACSEVKKLCLAAC